MLKTIRAVAFLLLLGALLAGAALPQPTHADPVYDFEIFTVPVAFNTVAAGVDSLGNITGTFDDASGLHGFLRSRRGDFVTFDVPSSSATLGFDVNGAGVAVGGFLDNTGSTEQIGFIRSRGGAFTTFTVPGNDGDTIPIGINIFGQISGFIENEDTGQRSGFLRNPNGSFITFSVPGTTRTEASKINDFGVIAGEYKDASGFHGFVRTAFGTIIKFELPGPAAPQESGQLGINNLGEIVGQYEDDRGAHGFHRRIDGKVTTLDVPGSTNTSANDINDFGVIVGNFFDQNGVVKAFIATPTACKFLPCIR